MADNKWKLAYAMAVLAGAIGSAAASWPLGLLITGFACLPSSLPLAVFVFVTAFVLGSGLAAIPGGEFVTGALVCAEILGFAYANALLVEKVLKGRRGARA